MDFVNDLGFSLYAVLVHLSAARSQLQKEEQSSEVLPQKTSYVQKNNTATKYGIFL